MTRYPTQRGGHASRRYEVWDLVDEVRTQIHADEVGSLSFTDDGVYLVCKGKPRPIFDGPRQIGTTPGNLVLLTLHLSR